MDTQPTSVPAQEYIPYRLSNIFNGGKTTGVTAWHMVPKLFKGSLGHMYTKHYNGKPVGGRWNGWRSNPKVIRSIIEQYEVDNPDAIKYDRSRPADDEAIVHLRMGDVIESADDRWKKSDLYEFIYKGVVIPVKKSHVWLIRDYEEKVKKIKAIGIKKIVLLGNMHHCNTTTTTMNKQYLACMVEFFEEHGFNVEVNIPPDNAVNSLHFTNVDAEFIYMTKSKVFVPSKTTLDTSFSVIIGRVVKECGGIVI